MAGAGGVDVDEWWCACVRKSDVRNAERMSQAARGVQKRPHYAGFEDRLLAAGGRDGGFGIGEISVEQIARRFAGELAAGPHGTGKIRHDNLFRTPRHQRCRRVMPSFSSLNADS